MRSRSSANHMQNWLRIPVSLSGNVSSRSEDPPIPNLSGERTQVWWFVGSSCWVVCTRLHSPLTLLLYITGDRCSDLTVWPRMTHLTILATSWNATGLSSVKTLLPLCLLVWLTGVMLATGGRTWADTGILNLQVTHHFAVVPIRIAPPSSLISPGLPTLSQKPQAPWPPCLLSESLPDPLPPFPGLLRTQDWEASRDQLAGLSLQHRVGV